MTRFSLLILVILVLAVGPVGAESLRGVPQPCFVPPHPKKEGGRPRVEVPARLGGVEIPGPGGAASPYHDTHLTRGVQDAAAATPTTLNAVVLLVDFDDQGMGEGFAADNADSSRIYFERVLTHLNQMYTEMSDGLLTIQWDITSIYRMPEPMSYYGLDDSIATREAALCRDAVLAADADVDFSQYDTFMLFHAGVGQEADISNNSQEAIWSVFFRTIDFQYWLDDPARGCEPYVYNEDCGGILTGDPDPGGGFFQVPDMVVLPEAESQDGFQFGMLGVVAHEFGHGFGLPDLYDTTAPEDFIFADSQGIGAFGLMGAGIWNENGFFPAEMCAWSKFYVGWLWPRVLRPDEVGSELAVTLEAIQHDRRGGAVRIPLGGDEYLLIENRLRDYNGNGIVDFDDADDDSVFTFWVDSYAGAEFDWYLPRELGQPEDLNGLDGSGLLIWHIDESIIRDLLFYNLVNSEALHKGVDLEEADGIQDLDKLEFTFEAFGDSRDSYWAPYATEFTPESEPSTAGYNNAFSGIWITDISGPGSEMTFKLRFAAPGDVGDFRPGWPRDLSGLTGDYQPVTGDLDGDGTQEIALGVTLENGDGAVGVFTLDGDSFFNPGGSAYVSLGKLNSDPILVNLDGDTDPLPELVWVADDAIYARKGNGSYLDASGNTNAGPVPYYTFDRDPGRVRLSAGHIEPEGSSPVCGLGPMGEDQPEILVGVPSLTAGQIDILAISPPTQGASATHARVRASLPGTSAGYATAMNIDAIDGGLREVVTSVRTGPGRGYLSVLLYDNLDPGAGCVFDDVRCIAMTRRDSVAFTDPVAADLNRDGIDEILVGDGNGYVHLLGVRVQTADGTTKQVSIDTGVTSGAGGDGSQVIFDNTKFEEHPGWPILIGVLENDALSVADVDGDGMLEALVFGPGNQLHVYNYNGTSILSLPVNIPGEDRFETPFLSPLVLDVDGDPEPEFLLPLPDGQVRGHDLTGRRLNMWSYLGGGNQGTYPVVADLDEDGSLELVTVEDVTTAIPDTLDLGEGDTSPGLPRTGRLLVRNVGPGSGAGPWPVFRHDPARSGRATLPAEEPREDFTGFMSEAFVMPNPVVDRESAKFHYKIRSDVQQVKVEVFTADGRLVTTLNGPVYANTDNLLDWNLTNDRGHDVAPGLYVARIQAFVGSDVEVRTMNFVVVR